MAGDNQLLDTARDYFRFVTNFFEVIDLSATHIYHSALELSPLSSIVRKFYYHQRPHPSPRVVIGTPDFWYPSIAISVKQPRYLSSAWSPCAQSVAVGTEGAVEIRDSLTLELISTLQAIEKFSGGLAYSPDGKSLACCSEAAIVIWDAQTGGVVKEIECEDPGYGVKLLWSLDGETIGTVSSRAREALTVHMYNVVSGENLSPGSLQSGGDPYFWAYGNSFRVMTMAGLYNDWTINIFEVGSALAKIESFPFQPPNHNPGAFSPVAYRVSVSVLKRRDFELLVLDIRNSTVLLQETGTDSYDRHAFSPDGGYFAAFAGDNLPIWKYTSGSYTRWREFRQAPMALQFSPILSSVLGQTGDLLHVLHLDDSPATQAKESTITASGPYDAFSPDCLYVTTANCKLGTIMITNLRPQNPPPSQFIDTGLKIVALILTGNVLLVKDWNTIVAWLLTEEGAVHGVSVNERASRSDSLWDISLRGKNSTPLVLLGQREDNEYYDAIPDPVFSVEDETAVIRRDLWGASDHTYRIGTGEIIKPVEMEHVERIWYRFRDKPECDFYNRDLWGCDGTSDECEWHVLQTALQEGWVKDPEGKHRLWLHARWRLARGDVRCFDKVATLWLRSSSERVVIKI